MSQISAGILVYRIIHDNPQYLLVHPGGPFFNNKDQGSWSIPKGLVDENEDLLEAAKREFTEETGVPLAKQEYISLGSIKQKGGKVVYGWGVENNISIDNINSNTFELEWPPKSGVKQYFPEIDKAMYFDLATAQDKILPAQKDFITRLNNKLNQKV